MTKDRYFVCFSPQKNFFLKKLLKHNYAHTWFAIITKDNHQITYDYTRNIGMTNGIPIFTDACAAFEIRSTFPAIDLITSPSCHQKPRSYFNILKRNCVTYTVQLIKQLPEFKDIPNINIPDELFNYLIELYQQDHRHCSFIRIGD